jgi:hypothetical protein
MVKVQNGWQSRSLEEMESLASQQASPRSSASGFHSVGNYTQSPRTATGANAARKWSSSEGSELESGTREEYDPHVRNTTGSAKVSTSAPRRALAPPPDIVSGNRRRPTPNISAVKPVGGGPYMPSRNLHTSSSTPKHRTPSQNAAMEADAVETLLFMASPVNSGYHPNAAAPPESSLRSTAGFSAPTSAPGSQATLNGDALSRQRRVEFADPPPSGTNYGATINHSRDIERLLDDSDDSSSDGLEDAVKLVNRQTGLLSGS